jgi:hypothetical protein
MIDCACGNTNETSHYFQSISEIGCNIGISTFNDVEITGTCCRWYVERTDFKVTAKGLQTKYVIWPKGLTVVTTRIINSCYHHFNWKQYVNNDSSGDRDLWPREWNDIYQSCERELKKKLYEMLWEYRHTWLSDNAKTLQFVCLVSEQYKLLTSYFNYYLRERIFISLLEFDCLQSNYNANSPLSLAWTAAISQSFQDFDSAKKSGFCNWIFSHFLQNPEEFHHTKLQRYTCSIGTAVLPAYGSTAEILMTPLSHLNCLN